MRGQMRLRVNDLNPGRQKFPMRLECEIEFNRSAYSVKDVMRKNHRAGFRHAYPPVREGDPLQLLQSSLRRLELEVPRRRLLSGACERDERNFRIPIERVQHWREE